MTSLDAELEEMGLAPMAAQVVSIIAPEPTQDTPLRREWERCRGWLEAAAEGSLRGIAVAERAVFEGRAQLHPGKRCAIVTELDEPAPGMRVVSVWLAGGEMDEIRAMIPGLMAQFRLQGCSKVLVEGRRGWERALKVDGFSLRSVTLEADL